MNIGKLIDNILTGVGAPVYYTGVLGSKVVVATGKAVSPENIRKHGGNVTLAATLATPLGLSVAAKLQAANVDINKHELALLLPAAGSTTVFKTDKTVPQDDIKPSNYFQLAKFDTGIESKEKEPLPYYTAETIPPAINANRGESVTDTAIRSGPVLNDDDCLKLRDGNLFCTSDVWLTSLRDPSGILERQSEYVDFLLELEKEKNLPKGMLVVMTLIESQLGENMGKNGCSITGKHCGYHQASVDFAKQAGFKPEDRFNKYKSAEMAVKMAYTYLREDPRYHEGMALTTSGSYLRHQQGVQGWCSIEKAVLHGVDSLTEKEKKLVRLQTAYNLPKPWSNAYVVEFKRKNGKIGRRLKNNVTTQEAAELFHYGWTNEMLRLSKIVESLKKDKLMALYGTDWQIASTDVS